MSSKFGALKIICFWLDSFVQGFHVVILQEWLLMKWSHEAFYAKQFLLSVLMLPTSHFEQNVKENIWDKDT